MRGVQGEVGAIGQKGNDGQQGAPGIQVLNWLLSLCVVDHRNKYISCLVFYNDSMAKDSFFLMNIIKLLLNNA